MIRIIANKTHISVFSHEPITSGAVQVFECEFDLSSDYDGMSVRAVFMVGTEKYNVLLDEAKRCEIPWELLQNPNEILYVGVYGTLDDGTALPTIWEKIGEISPGSTPDGAMNSREPTPSEMDAVLQIMTETSEAEAARKESEEARVNAESERAHAENNRVSAENERKAAEEARVNENTGIVAQAANAANQAMQSVKRATASEASAAEAAQDAAMSASDASRSANRALTSEDSAKASEAKAKAWANTAQGYAEMATVPAVDGVYNYILADRVTGDRYALIVENGRVVLLGVKNTLDANNIVVVDPATGIAYALVVDNGRLGTEEVL